MSSKYIIITKSTTDEIVQVVGLYQTCKDKQNDEDFDQIVGVEKQKILSVSKSVILKAIFGLLQPDSYHGILTQFCVGNVIKLLEKLKNDVSNLLSRYICPLKNEFTSSPIRIRKTRIVFDREEFLRYFKMNRRLKTDETTGKKKKFIICPVTKDELVHPIKHQSKQLLAELEMFRDEFREKRREVLEIVMNFIRSCRPHGEEMVGVEKLVLQIFESYELVFKDFPLSMEYLTQKIEMLQYFRQVFDLNEPSSEDSSPSSTSTSPESERRKNSVIEAIYELGRIYYERKEFEKCIENYEKELYQKFGKSDLGEEKYDEVLKKTFESYDLLIRMGGEPREKSMEEKVLFYLLEYLKKYDLGSEGEEEVEGEGEESRRKKSQRQPPKEMAEEKFRVLKDHLVYYTTSDQLFEEMFRFLFVEVVERQKETNSLYPNEEGMLRDLMRKGNEFYGVLEGTDGEHDGKLIRILEEMDRLSKHKNIGVVRRMKDLFMKVGKKDEAMKLLLFLMSNVRVENFVELFGVVGELKNDPEGEMKRRKRLVEQAKEKYLEEAMKLDPENIELVKISVDSATETRDWKKICKMTHCSESVVYSRIREMMDIREAAALKIIRYLESENRSLKLRVEESVGKKEFENKKLKKQNENLVERNSKLEDLWIKLQRNLTGHVEDMEEKVFELEKSQVHSSDPEELKKLEAQLKEMETTDERKQPSPAKEKSRESQKSYNAPPSQKPRRERESRDRDRGYDSRQSGRRSQRDDVDRRGYDEEAFLREEGGGYNNRGHSGGGRGYNRGGRRRY